MTTQSTKTKDQLLTEKDELLAKLRSNRVDNYDKILPLLRENETALKQLAKVELLKQVNNKYSRLRDLALRACPPRSRGCPAPIVRGVRLMSAPVTPKVLTANALLEGDVAYLAPDGGWTRQHDHALLITDAATAELHLLDAAARGHVVVGA